MSLPVILQQLNNSKTTPSPNNPMVSLFKGMKDPQKYIQDLMTQNDPRVKQVVDYINANGGNAQQAFYKFANESGIDPQMILNMMK